MRPILFCIVGPSGVGKTMLSEALQIYAGIPLIESITDRPKRHKDESGHTFVEPSEFDLIHEDEKIAFTNFGGYRYCCLHSSIQDVNTYVVTEDGLQYMKEKFSDLYKIVSIRLCCDKQERIKRVGEERVARDHGKFTMELEEFDKVVVNNSGVKLDLITDVWQFVKRTIEELTGLQGCENGMEYAMRD